MVPVTGAKPIRRASRVCEVLTRASATRSAETAAEPAMAPLIAREHDDFRDPRIRAAFLIAPLATLGAQAFTAPAGQSALSNFAKYFQTPGLLRSLINTGWLAAVVAALVLPMAFVVAFTLERTLAPMKGVLAVKGREMRFVFQGVHMLMDGKPDRPWGTEPRQNTLVFIGRNLDRQALNEGFRACLA